MEKSEKQKINQISARKEVQGSEDMAGCSGCGCGITDLGRRTDTRGLAQRTSTRE